MPLYVLARIDAEFVAVPADHVKSVITVGRITPVPHAARHVAGLCALRSQVLTVVDTRAALGRAPITADAQLAIVIEIGAHCYALLVDGVDDIVEAGSPHPCPVAMTAAWARVSCGLIEHAGVPRLKVSPEALIAGRAM